MSISHKERYKTVKYSQEYYNKIGSYQIKVIDVFIFKTGEYIGRFNSIKECCEKLNISKSHIGCVLSGKRKRVNIYTFKEVI